VKVEPGQVYLVRHNGREDPFLVLEARTHYSVYDENGERDVFKWTVLNLSTMQQLYVYDSELSDPDPIEEYHAITRLF